MITVPLRTGELHYALQLVAEERVVFHDICYAHISGYSWAGGGEMPFSLQSWLSTLDRARLIGHDGHDPCGNSVRLTLAGSDRLREWHLQTVGGAV